MVKNKVTLIMCAANRIRINNIGKPPVKELRSLSKKVRETVSTLIEIRELDFKLALGQ